MPLVLALTGVALADPPAAVPGTSPSVAPPTVAAPLAAPPPPATALTAEKMAIAPKPKGFRYSILRGALVEELQGTILYVKAKKTSVASKAVPVPQDRELLAACLSGGKVEDLIKGARVTVRFDPRGVVRPQIVIDAKVAIEVLDGAKVMDRGGDKLYVVTADGARRGFQIEGGAAGWKLVVQGGRSAALLAGAVVRIEHDPSGRQPLKIAILKPPPGATAAGKGCGCAVQGSRQASLPVAPLLVVIGAMGLLALRRHRG